MLVKMISLELLRDLDITSAVINYIGTHRYGKVLVSICWEFHVVNRTRTSCYFSWKRCWLVFSYHGELSSFQLSKYIKYSAYTGCISLSTLFDNMWYQIFTQCPENISHFPKHFQVSRFPAKSPDSRNKFVFLPKQPLLELSPPVMHALRNFHAWFRSVTVTPSGQPNI